MIENISLWQSMRGIKEIFTEEICALKKALTTPPCPRTSKRLTSTYKVILKRLFLLNHFVFLMRIRFFFEDLFIFLNIWKKKTI